MSQLKMLVPRIAAVTNDQFLILTQHYSRPIVLTGIVDKWQASSLWTPEYFQRRIGARPVMVSISNDGVFRGDPETGFTETQKRMPFSEFAKLTREDHNGRKYYLAQNTMEMGAFAVLQEEIERPYYIPAVANVTTNVWFGPANIISPLHFDRTHNFFAQIRGAKRFVLYDEDETSNLYPYPPVSMIAHMSQVDIDKPNLQLYPDFIAARAYEVELNTGDLLFLPKRWWHQVYSHTPSISVNFWWSSPGQTLLSTSS